MKNRALLLDRDGVINETLFYESEDVANAPRSIEDFRILPIYEVKLLPDDKRVLATLKNKKGLPMDSELRLWHKDGFRPIKILKDYDNDPDSLNYGVVVYRSNPFYKWPAKKLLAYLLSNLGPKFIRSNF